MAGLPWIVSPYALWGLQLIRLIGWGVIAVVCLVVGGLVTGRRCG